VWFSVLTLEKGDSGVMLRYLQSRGGDIKRNNLLGQSVLHLVVTGKQKEAIPVLKYLVEEHGLSLTEKDSFGTQALHWAVLHGQLEVVKWISRRTCDQFSRADWFKAFQEMKGMRLIRPEHMGAIRSWSVRGLQKSARSLTPLGVAVLHNHEEIAKWLMGYGDDNPKCARAKRANLFEQGNRDLLLVAKTWPDLLPEVLKGFVESSHRSSWFPTNQSGWFERNYDIRLLYGLPEVPVEKCPISILLNADYPELFELKVVKMVVALKWSIFGYKYYFWELLRYILLTTAFILGFIVWAETEGEDSLGAGSGGYRGQGGVSQLICGGITLYNLLVEEGRELKASHSYRKYFYSGWNLQSLSAYFLILGLIILYGPWYEHEREWEDANGNITSVGILRRVMTAPASLFLLMRFMEHLAIWRSTGIFIAVIRMMLVDTGSWSILFILFEVIPSSCC
ncbi:unnamed protein product, partial [Discosporangium mesarthrocarpum]